MNRRHGALLAMLTVLAPAWPVHAVPISHVLTLSNRDWTSAGVGGVGGGTGQITIAGVNGPVRRAFLYWHGIATGSGAVYDNATVSIDGHAVTGTGIGDATTNCWGSGSSRAFRAEVTPFVTGNGTYTISGLTAESNYDANGASLVVVFDDGNPANDRDLAFFEGNDSSDPQGFPGEDEGWNATLPGIEYRGGTVSVQVHLADGQSFGDDSLTFSSSETDSVSIPDTSTRYDGNSVPNAGTSRSGNDALWDIHTFDITEAFGAPGSTTLDMAGMDGASDCLGLVLLLMDLEPGSAPAPCAAGAGSPCDDGDPCTTDDVCVDQRTCVGTPLCAPAGPCEDAVCDPGTGTCSRTPLTGSPCDDGDACTQTDVCEAGTCVGSNPVVCTATCGAAGTCNPVSGACPGTLAPDGMPCSDGNACNGLEVCQAGICTVPTEDAVRTCVAAAPVTVVSNFGDGTASVLDGTSLTVPVGAEPWGVAVDPSGTHAYVGNRAGNSVSVVDTTTGAVTATIPVGREPLGVAVHPAGTRAYVTSYFDDTIAVIDTATETVVGTIRAGVGPAGLALNASGTRLYVANYAGDSVSVVDTATHAVLATVPVGTQPVGVAVDPVRSRLLVTNFGSGTVSVLGTLGNTVLTTVEVGREPFGVAVDGPGSRGYVANIGGNSLSIIDTGIASVLDDLAVGSPFGVSVAPMGPRVYVTSGRDGTVAVVEGGALAGSMPVGRLPVAFGDFVGVHQSLCGSPPPVCDDADPFTADACTPAIGCTYTSLPASDALGAGVTALDTAVGGASVDALGGQGTKRRLEALIDAIQGSLGDAVRSPRPAVTRAGGTARRTLRRTKRRLARFDRVVRKGVRKGRIQRDLGWTLLDTASATSDAARAQLAGRAKGAGTGAARPAPAAVRARRPPPPPLPR